VPKTGKDDDREERIIMEVVVDAYGPEERSMGWYYYLADTIQFPFAAKCKSQRSTSPLRVGNAVEAIEMADADECQHEMFVNIRWDGDTLAVPLAQLEPVDVEDEDTIQAVEDWHYWTAMNGARKWWRYDG